MLSRDASLTYVERTETREGQMKTRPMGQLERSLLRGEAFSLGLCGECYLDGKRVKAIQIHFNSSRCAKHAMPVIVAVTG